MYYKNITLGILGIFLFVPNLFAGPLITSNTGSIIHSESIFIIGSGFGTKTTAAPVKYDDFENGTLGNDIGVGPGSIPWYKTSNNSAFKPKYSNEKTRITGEKCALQYFDSANNIYNCTLGLAGYSHTKLYVSGWYYNETGGNASRIFKYIAFRGGNSGDWAFPNGRFDVSPKASSGQMYPKDCNGNGDAGTYAVGADLKSGSWNRFEVWIDQGTPGKTDGEWWAWRNLKLWGKVEPNTYSVPFTNTSCPFNNVYLASYFALDLVGTPLPWMKWFWSEVYIDTTRARVEIGNASTWDACTHREIQIPTSWSSSGTSIQVKVNQGSFKAGDTAYLFVVDANGNVSNGYPITIGSGSGGGVPIDTPPTISITSPTSAASYTSPENIITISGTAADDKLITGIKWANSSGGSGNAIDSAGNWSKFFADISLKEGENVITVTATDSNNKTTSDTLTVTYNSGNMTQSFSAIKQTADSNWKDSGVTYCVRLLIEGAHITQSGGHIILGFKGRSSGNYSIRKVSIAERDVNSSVGNVVDSTWTRVTFNGKAYNTWELDEAVVLAGTEKQSDPIPFSIEAGKDYYVTFKIVSPSVYLSPPSSYRELYFWDADHAGDIDWAGNGHSLTQDYHALSSIYVISNTDLLPPRDVTNVNHSKNGSVLTFTWTNPKSTENGNLIPENKDFAGVMIRYNTGKGALPPASHSEGTLFFDKPGNLDTNDSCTNTIGLGQDYSFSLFTYDSSGNYSHTVYVTVDANPPGVIKNFIATSGEKQITLSWTNPSDQDYAGTVIRYAANAYPSNEKDGSLVVDKKGTPSGNSSFIHVGLQNGLTYYYSAFAYDPSGNYSQAVNVSKAPSAPLDTTPPAPPAGTVVK